MRLEDRVKEELARRAVDRRAPEEAWERIETRLARPTGGPGRVAAAAVALFVASSALGFLAWAFFADGGTYPADAAWRGLWPHETRAEAEAAQRAADRGDARVRWQILGEGDEVVARYVRDVLGWSEARPVTTQVAWVARWLFVRCAPGVRNTDYPDIGCAPGPERVYPSAHITVERLIDSDGPGVWTVTKVEPGQLRQAVPATEEEVRTFVAEFLDRRVRGSEAERYLAANARDLFGDGADRLGPLYRPAEETRYVGYEIVSVDGPSWPHGTFTVAVRLEYSVGGHDRETLFVGPAAGGRSELVIVGGHRGFGP